MHPAREFSAVLEPVIGCVYFAPEVHDAFEALGFGGSSGTFSGVAGPDMTAYFCSRGASMGQVPGTVVASAFAVFNPALVVPVVDGGWAVADAGTLVRTRVAAVAAALERVLGPADDTVAELGRRFGEAAAGLPLPGRPLFAGLRSLEPPTDPWQHLHWAGDMLREYRGDSHTIAWAQRGLSACEIGLLSEASWGLPLRSYSRTRAWSDADFGEAHERLREIGWLDDDGLTEFGAAERAAIEDTTDQLCEPIIDAFGDHLADILSTLGQWSAEIHAAKCYPAAGPQDLAGGR